MRKKMKSITSLAIAATMLASCMFAMPVSAEDIDASTLIVESLDVVAETETEIENIFVGDYYVGNNTIDGWSFNEVDATSSIRDSASVKIGKKFWINDHGFSDGIIGRQITFRPTAEGQYTAYRTSTSGAEYSADTYLERYVGDNWGYGGYGYKSSVYDTQTFDISAAATSGGYAIYTIEITEASCLDDAYFGFTYLDTTSDVKLVSGIDHRGAIVVGVPLEDYYDTAVMGKQTVAVPLSRFEFSENEDAFVGVSASDSRKNYAFFADRDAWRSSQKIQFNNFSGMGILREDTNPDAIEGFEVHVYGMSIVNNPGVEIALEATAGESSSVLSWNASGYTDTVYEITKTDGTTTETIDAGSELS